MITTNYVWTKKGQLLAEMNNLETRAENTPASFAYAPLEKSPVTAKAWEEDGVVTRTKNPLPYLYFNSKKSEDSIHLDMVTFFQNNNITWRYKDFIAGKILAAIINDEMVEVNCQHITGDLYMITEKDAPLDLLFEAARDKIKEVSCD